MSNILTHPNDSIYIEEISGKHAILVDPRDGLFTPKCKWVTNYPLELIEPVLRVNEPAYLCDEIMRDEDPDYVQNSFTWDILSYTGQVSIIGKRILDFGSGSGTSSMVLARMFPNAEIVDIEFVSDYFDLTRHRAEFYRPENRVSFQLSPDSNTLPTAIGKFDYIVFSAVYEHLLPRERQVILPLLWSHLKQGGIIFLDQTPYRWYPFQMDTKGLPFINYLPDRRDLYCVRWFSRRVRPDKSWSELLRGGIRGGNKGEIMKILDQEGRKAILLNPSQLGVKDHIDLWYRLSNSTRKPRIKKFIMFGFRAVKAMTGVTMIPALSLAIMKEL